ncbi:MAG: hypothetical protein ABL994_20630 [Verrucomicrobiales bacterium]
MLRRWVLRAPLTVDRQLRACVDHLRTRRLDLGPLQREVADQTGVTEASVLHWESNAHAPTKPWMIAGIIRFLGYCPLPPPATRGEQIHRIRLVQGINFEEAAAEIGISSPTLLTWKNDRGRPDDPRCRGKLQAWLDRNASNVYTGIFTRRKNSRASTCISS